MKVSLRAILLGLWLLVVIVCVALGVLMAGLFQLVVGAEVRSVHSEVLQAGRAALTILRPMIFVAPVPAFVMALEANSNKFSFCSATPPCKRRNCTSDAGRNSEKRSTIGFGSRL